jgi:hypothetical protein
MLPPYQRIPNNLLPISTFMGLMVPNIIGEGIQLSTVRVENKG